MAKSTESNHSILKSKHRKKLFKYIEDDDKDKFRHFTKKYELDIKSVRVGSSSDTLLHQVSLKGAEHILRYLLKKGVDPLTKNDRGEIPLHKACRYLLATTNKHAYSDIVQPLMDASADSLRQPDKQGVTPQDILYVWEERQQKKSHQRSADTLISSGSEDSDSSGSSADSKRWSERLKDETEAEYTTNWGMYEDDFYQDHNEETYRDWGNRISQEHREKHKRKYAYHTRTTEKKQKVLSEEEEHKRRAFQKKLEEEHHEYIERVKKAKEDRERTKFLAQKVTYEKQCKIFFSNPNESLGYRQVPWPYPTDKGIKGMKELLLCDIDLEDKKTVKKYLRDQQVRWHPDRFVQKCGHLLEENEREKILKRVNQVSQEINKISHEVL